MPYYPPVGGGTPDAHHTSHEDGGSDEIDATGLVGAGTPSDILDIPTAETDDTLVLAPDGAGGVEFRAETGGGGGGSSHEDFWTPPDSAGTYDEEFSGTADTLPANWSWTTAPSGGAGVDWFVNSKWANTLMIERPGSGTTTYDLRRTSLTPGAIDVGFWWYMDLGMGRWNNNTDNIEVLFLDSSGSAGFGIKITKTSVLGFASRDRTGGTTSDVSVENGANNDTRSGVFCGVTRKISDNTWRAFIGPDGRSWETLGVSTTRAITIDHMQVTFGSGGNQGVSRIFFGPLRYRADLLQWSPR